MHSSWPPGSRQSSLRFPAFFSFPFFSPRASLHLVLAPALPAATVQEVDGKRRKGWGEAAWKAGETVSQKIHQQVVLATVKSPPHHHSPLPPPPCRQTVFPTIAEPSSHCKFSITERIHADTGRRMCAGMGTGI